MADSHLRDVSGNVIPSTRRTTTPGIDRVIAVPPVRDVPNQEAQEFLFSAFRVLPNAGAAFLPLTDPVTALDFAAQIPALYRGRLKEILIYCPDMIAAGVPYLFVQLTIESQPANAWGAVPIWPRAGVAALSFESAADLPPGATLRLSGLNTDAVNPHFLGIYLRGWIWPNDIVEG